MTIFYIQKNKRRNLVLTVSQEILDYILSKILLVKLFVGFVGKKLPFDQLVVIDFLRILAYTLSAEFGLSESSLTSQYKFEPEQHTQPFSLSFFERGR